MKRFPLLTTALAALFFCSSISIHVLGDEEAQEEALFVRRILEFWKDREPVLVKMQIKQFFERYPQSIYTESLLVILGDTHWSQKDYLEALNIYNSIQAPHFREKVFNNRLDCLYHLERYSMLAEEILPRLPKEKRLPESAEEALWMYYFAEALFQDVKQRDAPIHENDQLDLAKRYFELLQESDYKTNAKLSLAEIQQLEGHPDIAVKHYLEMAETTPDSRADMLLQAAQLKSEQAPDEAIALYAKVQGENGPKAAEAALRRLQLLFEHERFPQILEGEEEFRKSLKEEQQQLLEFYLGRSHFALNEYAEAVKHLAPLQRMNSQDPILEKAILLTLISSYYHINQLDEVEKLSTQYLQRYPADEALPRVLYLQAMTFKNHERYKEARELLTRLLNDYPHFEKSENVEFEHALILYKLHQLPESRQAFIVFTQKHPRTALSILALPYIPQISQQLLDAASEKGQDAIAMRKQLLHDIQLVLAIPDAVTTTQRPKYYLKAGKTLYEMQRYQEAINLLNNYVTAYPEDPFLYQAHLLIATCYQEGLHDLPHYIEESEKALALEPHYVDRSQLHVNLFSAHHKLSQEAEQSQEHLNKAAEHLLQALLAGHEGLKQENKLWLANLLYDRVKDKGDEHGAKPLQDEQQKEQARKALAIYEKIFNPAEDISDLLTNSESTYLEPEFFKMSQLYGWLDQPKAQIRLLLLLQQAQQQHPSLAWTLRSRTPFALAIAYRRAGDKDKALEVFSRLMTMKNGDPYIVKASKLEWARLKYDRLPASQRRLDQEDMVSILKVLKDLQIKRTLIHEPIHLEAALDYATIRSELEPPEKRDEQMRFLLTRMKEEFASRDDLCGKDYYESRQKNPDKDFIYQAYLMLIDGHLLRIDAKVAGAKGRNLEKEMKNEAAKSIYQSLAKGKFAVSPYLVEHANKGLESLP